MSEEIKKLTETVMGMESSRASDRKVFLDKLNGLEEKKSNTEDKIKMIFF